MSWKPSTVWLVSLMIRIKVSIEPTHSDELEGIERVAQCESLVDGVSIEPTHSDELEGHVRRANGYINLKSSFQ